MLLECKEIDGELYVPLKTAGEILKEVWPFPKDGNPIPWTAKEVRDYMLNNTEEGLL